MAELLAERGVAVDRSAVYDWVRAFAPLCAGDARPFRRAVGTGWSVDETYTKVAGQPVCVDRAIDGHGQAVDIFVSQRRATDDAAAFFRHAIDATGVVPVGVTTDRAAASPSALAGARVLCRGHAFLRNPRGGFYDLARQPAARACSAAAVCRCWDALTAELSAR